MTQKIDILMAVYNGEKYILAQLQSLITQTYDNFRIIIRDNCSTDRTVPLIEEFSRQNPGKIQLIKGSENLGALGNFAALTNHSQANYIMFSDADDIWLSNKIEDSLVLMQKNEALYGKDRPLLIHTDLTVVNKNLEMISPSFWKYSKLYPHTANHLNRILTQNVITGCTMLINKPLLQMAMPIPLEVIMHDWWIGLVASAFGHIDVLNKQTILYRQHEKNDTGAKKAGSLTAYINYARKASQLLRRQELRQRIGKTINQASLFLNRFEKQLGADKKRIVQNYITLGSASGLQKRYLFLKYRYFKNTLARNIDTFVFL